MLDDTTSHLSYTLPVNSDGAPSPPAPDESVTVVVEPGGLTLSRGAGPAPARAQRREPPADTLELRCLFCEGALQPGTVPVRLAAGARHSASPLHVPAWVCRRCEQPYLEPQAVARVRAALGEARQGARLPGAASA